jgi:site-specific recombinase XerD
MLLDRLCSGFLLDCQVRNLSKVTTERNYRPILERLTVFLCNPQVKEIETHDLKKFVLSLQANDPQPWTLYTYIRAVKRLFNWATEEGVLEGNPAAPLKYPRIPRRQTEIFSPEEIDLLLTEAKEMSYRDYAICLLLLDSGLRRAELVNLKLDDVNLLTGKLIVTEAKGGKSRQIRIGNNARKALWLYVNQFRESETDYLFIGKQGKPLTANGLALMLRRLGKRTGLHVHAHKFRHTFATLFAVKVPNAILLAHVLGHESLVMSKHYVHLAGTQATDVGSPMDWLLEEGARS